MMMDGDSRFSWRAFVKISRPLALFSVFILFALGAGIAHFLGHDVNIGVYWLGQSWVSLLQFSVHFLYDYFKPLPALRPKQALDEHSSEPTLEEVRKFRLSILITALACLAALASITVLIIVQVQPALPAYLFMGLLFTGALLYVTPALGLENSGYGELTHSVLVAYLVPSWAFIIQTGELHRLLAMVGSILTVLHLAMLLALDLPAYASKVKHEKKTLMVRLGWHTGMTTHNVMVLSAFLLLALAAWLGFPWSITWPALLPLPLGLYQIWQMRAIANGAPPNWKALAFGAIALFGGMAYFMTFAFWIN